MQQSNLQIRARQPRGRNAPAERCGCCPRGVLARRSIGMNSAPGSASSEPHPAGNTANALRPQKAEGDLVRGRDARRGGAANRTTRTAERDIRDIGGPHTGPIGLTGPQGRCTVALNPRKESRIPHHRKPEKHCNISYLSRSGADKIRTLDHLVTAPLGPACFPES